MIDLIFSVEEVQRGKHRVIWSDGNLCTSEGGRVQLINMCFNATDSHEVGISDGEQIIWIAAEAWYNIAGSDKSFGLMVMGRRSFTRITCVYLPSRESAETVKQELEKAYLFWMLQNA